MTITLVSPSATSNIISPPLAFVRSGYVNLIGGEAYNVGHGLYGWSRVSGSAADAYDLSVTPTVVHPSGSNSRWVAFPLRCFCMLEGSSIGYSMSRVVVRL